MSEFTEKLNSSELVSNDINEIDKDQADVSLLIDTIRSEFKYWQPPKPLVVVPQIMADFIEGGKKEFKLHGAFCEIEEGYGPGTELYDWVFQKPNGQDLFARAWLDGYTVEKEKKYILKHIDLSEQYKNESVYLSHSRYAKLKHESHSKGADMSKFKQCHFIQSEIDKLNIGSYVKIRVEP